MMSDSLEKLKILVDSSCLHFAEDLAKPIEKKLKQYENIEKDFGFDLAVVFKALKQDCIYRKDCFPERIIKCSHIGIEKDGLRVLDEDEYYLEDTITVEYEEYGKTWALTKEALK